MPFLKSEELSKKNFAGLYSPVKIRLSIRSWSTTPLRAKSKCKSRDDPHGLNNFRNVPSMLRRD